MEESLSSVVNTAKNAVNNNLLHNYQSVRQQSLDLTAPLSAEDMQGQSMPDASPTKWHLAHTTWFFETFILQQYETDFRWYNSRFCHLFNSYYETVGTRHARPQRGLLTRPGLTEVLDYRENVNRRMQSLLQKPTSHDVALLVTIGLHHEMQHQELIATDLLHLLAHNPELPAVFAVTPSLQTAGHSPLALKMVPFEGGLVNIGAEKDQAQEAATFAYDCECPRHSVFIQPFCLANRLVSNAEWLAFMEEGGYENSLYWLADGWTIKQQEQWTSPLYWHYQHESWHQFGLNGLEKLNLAAPVCHISFYEADAYARWAGKRLPREQEWEYVAAQQPCKGNFLEQQHWRPQPARGDGIVQLFGDTWEWTQSSFSPYPGFKTALGALGEYNGKFMANQFVLRGGSCVTPKHQLRTTYRNFFYPQHRWQFTGVRLAEDR